MVLLLVFLVTVLLVNYQISRSAIVEQAQNSLERLASQVSSNVALESRALDQHVEMIRNSIELSEYMFIVVSIGSSPEPLQTLFSRKFGWLPVGHAMAISRKGKQLLPEKRKDFSAVIRDKIDFTTPTRSSFFILHHDVIHIVSVAPVYYQKEFLGNFILVRDLDKEWMTQVARESGGHLFLVNRSELVWTTRKQLQPGSSFSVTDGMIMAGSEKYRAQPIILDEGAKGLLLWFGLDEYKLTNALAKNGYLLLGGVLAGSLAILFSGFLMLRNFRSPLRNLLHKMQQVESGDFPRIEKLPFSDEISQLNNRFSEMVQSLESQQKEIETKNEQLAEQASTDVLTGLFNRRHLYDLFPKLLSESRRNNKQLVVILADLDKFKNINDRYGHLLGDECLRHFSHIMQMCCRSSDFIFRMGGEEFLILSIGDYEGGMVLAEKIRKSLESSPLDHKSGLVNLTVSIGVGAAPEGAAPDTLNEVLADVDRALYEAKARGRNRVAAVTSG